MPTPPYAQALVLRNGATAVAGGIACVVGDVLQFSPASVVGWQSCRWEIFGYPPSFAAPAGWTQDDVYGSTTGFPLAYFYAASGGGYTPPPVTLSVWGKILPRLRVNGALAGNDPTGQLTDMTCGVSAPSPNGLLDIAPFEQGQFGGWDEQLQVTLRAIDAKLTSSGSGGGASNTVTPVAIATTTATVSGTPGYVKLTGATGASTVTIATGFEVTIWNATAYTSTITNTHGATFAIAAGQSVTLISDATAGVTVSDSVGAP